MARGGVAGKSRRVSLVDGYRVTYSYARTYAFATLRAEQADLDAVIVTIFFLNHAPEHRHFQTMGEFTGLRDAFIRGYIECVMTKRAAS